MPYLRRSLWQLATLALTALQTTAQTTNTSSIPSIEIDLVYPANNAIYGFNYNTPWAPIVLALHDIRSAVQHTDITLSLTLTPPQQESTLTLTWTKVITAANVSDYVNEDGSPFLLVWAMNFNMTPDGIYQGGGWYAQLEADMSDAFELTLDVTYPFHNNTCSQLYGGCNCDVPTIPRVPYSTTNFTIYPGQGSDSATANLTAQPINTMPNITETCALPIVRAGFNSSAASDSCDRFSTIPASNASSCAYQLDAKAVSSISSVASSLAMAAIATTSATTTTNTLTTTKSRSRAIATSLPNQAPLLIGAGILGSLPFYL